MYSLSPFLDYRGEKKSVCSSHLKNYLVHARNWVLRFLLFTPTCSYVPVYPSNPAEIEK